MNNTNFADELHSQLMKNIVNDFTKFTDYLANEQVPRLNKFKQIALINRLDRYYVYYRHATQSFHHQIVFNAYENMFNDTLAVDDNMPCIQYFLQSDNRFQSKIELETRMERYLNGLFPNLEINQIINLIDVIKCSNPRFFAIRTRCYDVVNRVCDRAAKFKDVYSDGQNVHNHGIQEVVRDIKKEIPTDSVINLELYIAEIQKEICITPARERALERIETDASSLNLQNVLCYVWSIIRQSDHKVELIKRLEQELDETSNKCVTGYVTRLLNVLSGFHGSGITISIADELASVWNHKIQMYISESDELMDGLLTKNDEFKKFADEFRVKFETEQLVQYSPLFSKSFSETDFKQEVFHLYQKLMS